MTTIAKLIEMRDAERASIARTEYESALRAACLPSDGGGLLERHAMLEELWRLTKLVADTELGPPMESLLRRLKEAKAALRASDALPPGKGEA